MRLQMPQEEPVSLAATHPNLLPTVIQSVGIEIISDLFKHLMCQHFMF